MILQTLLDEYLADCERRVGMSQKTTKAYRSHIAGGFGLLAWLQSELGRDPILSDLTADSIQTYDTARKRDSKSQRTRAATMAAIKGWAKWLGVRKSISAETAAEIFLLHVKVSEKPKQNWATTNQVKALFFACGSVDKNHGVQLAFRARLCAAVLAVMAYAGLRRGEVCALRVEDVVLDGEMPQLTLRHAKGDKTRVVPLASEAVVYLRSWLDNRPTEDALLFAVPVFRFRQAPIAVPLKAGRLTGILKELCEIAGIDHRPLAPHAFRRFSATSLLSIPGCTLAHVRDFLGHTDIKTTISYVGVEAEQLRTFVSCFNLQDTRPAPVAPIVPAPIAPKPIPQPPTLRTVLREGPSDRSRRSFFRTVNR